MKNLLTKINLYEHIAIQKLAKLDVLKLLKFKFKLQETFDTTHISDECMHKWIANNNIDESLVDRWYAGVSEDDRLLAAHHKESIYLLGQDEQSITDYAEKMGPEYEIDSTRQLESVGVIPTLHMIKLNLEIQ